MDVDGDGELDVVASDGSAWADVDIMAWSADGAPMDGWPKYMIYKTESPIIGVDFDNDGRIEVIVVPYRTSIPTQVVAYRHDGSVPDGWPIDLRWMSFGGPTLGDLDGDGRLEMAVAIMAKTEAEGEVSVYGADGAHRPGWPKIFEKQFQSTPIFTDLDLDGDFEVLAGASLPHLGPGWLLAYHHDGTPYADTEILAEVSSGFLAAPLTALNFIGNLHPEILGIGRGAPPYAIDWQGNPVPGWPPEDIGFTEPMPVGVGATDGPAEAIWLHASFDAVGLVDRNGELLPGWPWMQPPSEAPATNIVIIVICRFMP